MRGIAKFITLYLTLVLTSGLIIALVLDTHWLAALGTASIGCVFKTVAASAHSWAWSQKAAKAIDGGPIPQASVACQCRMA